MSRKKNAGLTPNHRRLTPLRAALRFAAIALIALAWPAGSVAAGPTQPASAGQPVPGRLTRSEIQATQRSLSRTGLSALLTLTGHPVPIGATIGSPSLTRLLQANASRLKALPWAQSLPVLQPMARGNAVKVLQERLDALGANLVVDGMYGPETAKALDSFEAAHGIARTATVGVPVWTALLGIRVSARHRSVYALAQTYGTTPLSIAAWNPGLRLPFTSWGTPLTADVWLMPGDLLPSSRLLGTGTLPTAPNAGAGTPSSQEPASHRGTGGKTARQGKTAPAKTSSSSSPQSTNARPTSQPGTSPGSRAGQRRFYALVLAVGPTVSAPSLNALAAYMGGAGVSATVAIPPRIAMSDAAAVRALSLMGADLAVWVRPGDSAARVAKAVRAITQDSGSAPYLAYAGAYPTASQTLAASHADLGMLVVSQVLDGLSATVASAPSPGSVIAVQTSPDSAVRELKAFLIRARRGGAVPGPALSLLSEAP